MTHINFSLHPIGVSSHAQHHCSVLVFEDKPQSLHSFKIPWTPWLFNTPEYAHYQAKNHKIYTFVLANLTQTEALAFFHLFVSKSSQNAPRVGISPARASFGSFEMPASLSRPKLDYFIGKIKQFAKNQGIDSLQIKQFPACYAPAAAQLIADALAQNGFEVAFQAENQHLDVSALPFETHLHLSEKRRLRKCLRAGFVFDEWPNPHLPTVFDFIEQNRRNLGYAMTFDFATMSEWFALFPDHYRVFCVKDPHQIVALTVAVRVGSGVLYNFCPADHLHYRAFSPTVLLNAGLYRYCQQNQIEVLDLGVSTDTNGVQKASLVRFKSNMGAQMSQKTIFKNTL